MGSVVNRMGYTASYDARLSSLLMLLNNVKPCAKCEFCDNMKRIKAEPFMTAYLASPLCKVERRIIVHWAQGDNQDRSGTFVRNVLKLPYDTCGAHAGPIM